MPETSRYPSIPSTPLPRDRGRRDGGDPPIDEGDPRRGLVALMILRRAGDDARVDPRVELADLAHRLDELGARQVPSAPLQRLDHHLRAGNAEDVVERHRLARIILR